MSKLTTSLFVLTATVMMLPSLATAETSTANPDNAEVSTIGVMPHRGMTMERVRQSFGAPAKTVAAVGNPPISRWIYDGFVVYFENNHVIHSLATADRPQ